MSKNHNPFQPAKETLPILKEAHSFFAAAQEDVRKGRGHSRANGTNRARLSWHSGMEDAEKNINHPDHIEKNIALWKPAVGLIDGAFAYMIKHNAMPPYHMPTYDCHMEEGTYHLCYGKVDMNPSIEARVKALGEVEKMVETAIPGFLQECENLFQKKEVKTPAGGTQVFYTCIVPDQAPEFQGWFAQALANIIEGLAFRHHIMVDHGIPELVTSPCDPYKHVTMFKGYTDLEWLQGGRDKPLQISLPKEAAEIILQRGMGISLKNIGARSLKRLIHASGERPQLRTKIYDSFEEFIADQKSIKNSGRHELN